MKSNAAARLPATLAGADLLKVGQTIIKAGGDITKAAKKLGVPPADLRQATRAVPRLIDAALEAEEQTLDEAEAVIRRGLKAADLSRRLEAANYLLRTSPAARSRGWGSRKPQ